MAGIGPLISAVGHCGLLMGVLLILGQPTPFAQRPQEAIAVEIVTPREIEPPVQTAKESAGYQDAAVSPPPQQAQAESRSPTMPDPSSAGDSRPQPPSPTEQPDPNRHADGPYALMGPALPAPGVLDSSELIALYNLRTPGSLFDAPAAKVASLTSDEVARMKSYLRRCWQLPAGLAGAATRVVLRVFLNEDGSLAGEPTLVEASASRDGPPVMQAAIKAVQQCQPFAFLPRERYKEWKQLDVTFSPQEMAGR